MGLPGAGKTYLAKEVYRELNAMDKWYNIRKNLKIGISQKR